LLLLAVPAIVQRAVRGGLRPLEGLAERVSTIDATLPDGRFETPGLPAELQPIARRLDELLARLRSSFERERRFSADVAHELRTPLFEMRTITDVSLASADPNAESTMAIEDLRAAALQMERIVTTLLALARCEAGHQPVTLQAVDLRRALDEAWGPWQSVARAKRLAVALEAEEAIVRTDQTLLASILGNLIANAVEYTREGGRISTTIATTASSVKLGIANTQRDLAAEDLDRLFDPFWRKDVARTSGSHAGLGLSLVGAFARLLGIEVAATLPTPELASFVLTFPRTR
jgi:two-component system sensor histidine kinase QseC